MNDELKRLIQTYHSNTMISIRKSNADQETKELIEELAQEMCDFMAAYSDTVSKLT